jgi:chemotaxis protein methyltransferase CheR
MPEDAGRVALLTPRITTNGHYRHVVFADALRGPARAMNFAPSAVPSRWSLKVLSFDQARFLRWLFDRAGLDEQQYREETLERRLPACLRALHAGSLSEARYLIERHPALLLKAMDAMILGVTGFFRDRPVFNALREQVLPTLGRPRVRVWSAGCSDGAELYSVAMLLDERGLLHRSHLLGTDCRPTAVRRAAAGSYSGTTLGSVSRDLLDRYFVLRSDQTWRVIPALRAATHWRAGDILRHVEQGPWDIILCRNVAMYLRQESAVRLWERLHDALRPGGVLVLGRAERPGGGRLNHVLPCVYRRAS